MEDFDQTKYGCEYIEILYRSNFHNSSAFYLTVVNKIKIIKFLSNSATSRKLLNLLRTPASWESIKSYRFEMVGELPEDFTKYIQILSVVCLSKDIYIQIIQKRIISKLFLQTYLQFAIIGVWIFAATFSGSQGVYISANCLAHTAQFYRLEN